MCTIYGMTFRAPSCIYQSIWRNIAEDSNLLFLDSFNGQSHIRTIINKFGENLAYDIGMLRM